MNNNSVNVIKKIKQLEHTNYQHHEVIIPESASSVLLETRRFELYGTDLLFLEANHENWSIRINDGVWIKQTPDILSFPEFLFWVFEIRNDSYTGSGVPMTNLYLRFLVLQSPQKLGGLLIG